MTDELLFSLRVTIVSGSRNDRALFRQATADTIVPIEVLEADGAATAGRAIASGVDLAFFDDALGDEAVAKMTSAARAASPRPFTVLLRAPRVKTPFKTDAVADKPSQPEDAAHLLARAIYVRLPSRVLVVDDSGTMRSIVRKILAATRFPLEVVEAEKGGDAVELMRERDFDLAFVDYNLPGLSGLETITEIRRAQRNPTFVLITSLDEEAIVELAHAYGIAFLKKPFFTADIEAILCGLYGLRALNPNRA